MNYFQDAYKLVGQNDFLKFITNPAIQAQLLPAKIVFIAFTVFFLVAVIYFYFNSTYIRHKFLQDTSEFLLWEAYGLREIQKQWQQITAKTRSGREKEFRLALVEADDFLKKVLKVKGYKGDTFEETVLSVNKKILPNPEDILAAHQVRNTIVHDPNYALDIERAKKMLADYEKAIKDVSIL